MTTKTGTSGNDTWQLSGAFNGTLDGLGGIDTLNMGTELRSSFTITANSDGSIKIDSVSGASSPMHATLWNMEFLVFNRNRDVLDLSTIAAPAPAVNHSPTGSVSISGTPVQGNTLTASNTLADADGLGTIGYQWLANGSNISGATSSTLTLSSAQVGKAITVKASYVDGLGNAESANSSATAPVGGIFQGSAASPNLQGSAGNDTFTGGGGIATVTYSGSRSNFSIGRNTDGSFTVKDTTGAEGTDTLGNIQRIQFADKKIALDLSATGNAGKALEFIGVLAPAAIDNPTIVGSVLKYFDQGLSMSALCQVVLDAGLVAKLAGSASNLDLARLVFRNVTGTEADATMANNLANNLQGSGGTFSKADFMAAIASLELNQTHVNLTGLADSGIAYL